ncbi:MAG: nucleotidyltransferase family protein [Acidimicrobiia bacterium]
MITAIVLAAGASERMGKQKLLLPFLDTTVLASTVAAACTSSVENVIVVTPPDSEAYATAVDDCDATIVINEDPSRGNMSSLLTAVDADGDAEAFILLAGDLPTLRTTAIDALVDLWDKKAPWAGVTRYTNRIAHPFLLSRQAIDDLRHLEGSKILWQALVVSADSRVASVERQDAAPLDVNTPGDYERLRGNA